MSKASAKKLSDLHGALADSMAEVLREGVTVVDREGEVQKVTPGAAYFAAIAKFLKDNNVENLAVGEQMEIAAKATFQNLPFTESDEYGSVN